jgi:hypothetical protein
MRLIQNLWIMFVVMLVTAVGAQQVDRFSQISPANTPATTDTVIGVQGGTTDVQYTFAQVAASVASQQSLRTVLTGNVTYYIATTGNDANPCTVGSPCLTKVRVWNLICQTLDIAGNVVTIQFANGTYTDNLFIGFSLGTGSTAATPVGGGQITFQGNTSDNTQVVWNGGTTYVVASGSIITSTVNFTWATAKNNTGTGIDAFYLTGDGNFQFTSMNFGIAGGSWVHAAGPLAIGLTNITMSGNPSLSSGQGPIYATGGAFVAVNGAWNATAALSWPTTGSGFVWMDGAAVLQTFGASFGTSGAGSYTGERYLADLNGIIQTFGEGATYFPGSTSGSTATGGQYN